MSIVLALAGYSGAVNSKITRQTTDKELREGKSEGVVITSPGTIQLGRAAKVLANEFEKVWSVNSIVVSGGTTYIGTSPNGAVYQYRLGTLTKLYSADANAPVPARKHKRPATPAPVAIPDQRCSSCQSSIKRPAPARAALGWGVSTFAPFHPQAPGGIISASPSSGAPERACSPSPN